MPNLHRDPIHIHSGSRIAVRVPNALGDAVMATPALSRLAEAVGHGNLTLVGPPVALSVLSGGPWIGQTISLDASLRRGIGGHFRLAKMLRPLRLDAVFCFPNSFGSLLPFWLARIPNRIGYRKDARGLLLTHSLPRPTGPDGKFQPIYTGDAYAKLLDFATGVPDGPSHPQLFTTPSGEAEADSWMHSAGLQSGEPFMVVVPGASFGPSKVWIPERYASVARRLAAQRNMRILVSYGPGEESVAAAVKSGLGAFALPDARVSVDGLKSIFRRAAFVLTNDTGPRHLASAFNIPSVTIVGPVDRRLTDLPTERTAIASAGVPCAPCGKKVCPLPEHVCMTRLTADAVLEAASSIWPPAPTHTGQA